MACARSRFLVLVGHSLTFSTHARVGDLANLGVRVFFVISGLLITTLLLREHDKRGSISLGDSSRVARYASCLHCTCSS